MVSGPKYCNNINGIWALKPYHLSPWTHRDMVVSAVCGRGMWMAADSKDNGLGILGANPEALDLMLWLGV